MSRQQKRLEEQTVVDMTYGGGGHSRSILHHAPGVTLIAADRDPLAHRLSQSLALEVRGVSRVIPVVGRFSELPQHLSRLGVEEGSVDSFLFDLGASSMQFDTPHRGFSISSDGPLDMRMDGDRFPGSPTAADVVNCLSAGDLSIILKGYGEERHARSIAQAIVEARYAFGSITGTRQLAEIVDTVFEGNFKTDKLQRHAHPATRVFQALRIFVNNELNELNNGLEVAWRYLRPQGRCVVIAFHSLEDRIVKRHFHGIEMDAQANMTLSDHHRNSAHIHPLEVVTPLLDKRWRPLVKKVLTPSVQEVDANPRSRSAKLRAAVKL
ncbi:putative methyltransferase-like protein 15 homolog isoform X2 [Babylonia areolata]|uniref:putative methyltransferase-like protein 15 homolog isoform X2 n=1 Tax=Babylonia areolata TaxID=304850 RepID=UPI003FD631A5